MRRAVDHMMPQGSRHLKRAKSSSWVGPGVGTDYDTNLSEGIKLLAYDGHTGRPARSALDPRFPPGWWEGAWSFSSSAGWKSLGYAYAGSTSLTSGIAGSSDFVLFIQFPYEVERSAFTAVKLMSRAQQNMFVDGLKTLDSMDSFTAMVAGALEPVSCQPCNPLPQGIGV